MKARIPAKRLGTAGGNRRAVLFLASLGGFVYYGAGADGRRRTDGLSAVARSAYRPCVEEPQAPVSFGACATAYFPVRQKRYIFDRVVETAADVTSSPDRVLNESADEFRTHQRRLVDMDRPRKSRYILTFLPETL